MEDEVSYILEVAKKNSRPTYANFKSISAGEGAYKNALRIEDIERVRLIVVEDGRQKTLIEHSTVAPTAVGKPMGKAGKGSKPGKARKQTPPPGLGSMSLAITFALILLVVFFALKFGFEHLGN